MNVQFLERLIREVSSKSEWSGEEIPDGLHVKRLRLGVSEKWVIAVGQTSRM